VLLGCLNLITALSGRSLEHHRRINSKDWMQVGLSCRPQGRGRDAETVTNGDDFVGALDYGGNNNDARECTRTSNFRRKAARACGVPDKMSR
jgi:hypothetical protein